MCDSARDEGAASSASRAATRDGDVALLVARNDRYSGARAWRSRERDRCDTTFSLHELVLSMKLDLALHGLLFASVLLRLLDSSSFCCSVTSFCVPVKGAD